jgi:transposase-like protein
MTEETEAANEDMPTCPQCGSQHFSAKPIASSPQKVIPGTFRCIGCQSIWQPEDLVGQRFKFLRGEHGK